MNCASITFRSSISLSSIRVVPFDKDLEERLTELKTAHREQQFHIKKCQDMMPTLQKAEETMASQESIIKNFEDQIKDFLKGRDKAEEYERQIKLKQVMHEKEVLREKNNQLDLLFKMNEGVLPKELVIELAKDPLLKHDPVELKHLKEQANLLLQQIEHLSQDLEEVTIFNEVTDRVRERDAMNTKGFLEQDRLKKEIERNAEKAQRLEMQMVQLSKSASEQIAELKNKILLKEAQRGL